MKSASSGEEGQREGSVDGWSGMNCRSMGKSQDHLLVVPQTHEGESFLEVTSDIHIQTVPLAVLSLPPSGTSGGLLPLNYFSDPLNILPFLLKLP